MKKFCLCIFTAVFFIFSGCTVNNVISDSTSKDGLSEKDIRSYVNENDTWAICYQQGTRVDTYTSYDATSDHLYFSYMKNNCVDVYDANGVFCYSFIFPDRQNGGIYVRCEGEQIFISTKHGTLYIFENTHLIQAMDSDEAKEKGYHWNWFYDYEPSIQVGSKWICRVDANGTVLDQIPTPPAVRQSIPLSLDGLDNMIVPGIVVVLFLAAAYCFAFMKKPK